MTKPSDKDRQKVQTLCKYFGWDENSEQVREVALLIAAERQSLPESVVDGLGEALSSLEGHITKKAAKALDDLKAWRAGL